MLRAVVGVTLRSRVRVMVTIRSAFCSSGRSVTSVTVGPGQGLICILQSGLGLWVGVGWRVTSGFCAAAMQVPRAAG